MALIECYGGCQLKMTLPDELFGFPQYCDDCIDVIVTGKKERPVTPTQTLPSHALWTDEFRDEDFAFGGSL